MIDHISDWWWFTSTPDDDSEDGGDFEDWVADAPQQPYVWATPKVGRNHPNPCGSGKKYKKCCLSAD
jgi:hypothetical protein